MALMITCHTRWWIMLVMVHHGGETGDGVSWLMVHHGGDGAS